MADKIHDLVEFDTVTLGDIRFPETEFCVETLIPAGICILGGAPKVGKSWLALDLCMKVAKGERFWNQRTRQGTTLYLALEDRFKRVQSRLYTITDEMSVNAHVAVQANRLGEGLCQQIQSFLKKYPDTVLVVIDTFQIVRGTASDVTYAGDYGEVRQLKEIADAHGLTILLLHHLRKAGDSDPLNRLSGSTGLTGAMDAVYVLDRKRDASTATLTCTGRDIEDRKLDLELDGKNFTWTVLKDSMDDEDHSLPEEVRKLVDYMRGQKVYDGNNTDLTERFNSFSSLSLAPKSLKQKMNRYRYELEKLGVFFMDTRSNGQRFIRVEYHEPEREEQGSDASDGSDASAPASETCVTCVPDSEENGRSEISETVDIIETEAHPGVSEYPSENSDASCCSDASGSCSDEMDSDWVDKIRTALGVSPSGCILLPSDSCDAEESRCAS